MSLSSFNSQENLEANIKSLINHAQAKTEQDSFMELMQGLLSPLELPHFLFQNIRDDKGNFIRPVQLDGEKRSLTKIHKREAEKLKASIYASETLLELAKSEAQKAKESAFVNDPGSQRTDFDQEIQGFLTDVFKLEFKAENGKKIDCSETLSLAKNYYELSQKLPDSKTIKEKLYLPMIESMNKTLSVIVSSEL